MIVMGRRPPVQQRRIAALVVPPGAQRRRRRAMGDVATETWPTTGEIDTESASLQISVQQLGNDLFNSTNISPDDPNYMALQDAWNAFVQDFNQWFNASWFWNPSRRDELVSYRAQYNALLAQWKALGATTVAAPVAGASTTPPPGTLDKLLSIGGDLVWVVGIGAAVWVASTIYKEVRGRP